MPADLRTPKFKMPSVYKPKRDEHYRCKIGYWINPRTGKRERREFRLGRDPLAAYKTAVSLGEQWLREEERHDKSEAVFAKMFPSDLPSLPVWTGMPLIEAEAREEYLATPPDNLPDDPIARSDRAVRSARAVTLYMQMQDLLERLRRKADSDQKAPGTYSWYEREFGLGFVQPALDRSMSPLSLSLARVDDYCAYWTDLKARARESLHGVFGWRAACNRIDAFNALLHHMDGRVPGYSYPRGAAQVIAEAKKTVGGNLTAIWRYDAELLRSVIGAGDDRHRLIVYLFLNFGISAGGVRVG